MRVRDSSGKQGEKCKQIATVLIEVSLFRSRRNLATCCEHTRHNRRRLCTCQFAVNYAYSRVKPDTKLSLPLPLSLFRSLSIAASIPLTLAIGSNYIMTIAGRRPAARCMYVAGKAKHCMRLVAKLATKRNQKNSYRFTMVTIYYVHIYACILDILPNLLRVRLMKFSKSTFNFLG